MRVQLLALLLTLTILATALTLGFIAKFLWWKRWDKHRRQDRRTQVQKDKLKYGIYAITFSVNITNFAMGIRRANEAFQKAIPAITKMGDTLKLVPQKEDTSG